MDIIFVPLLKVILFLLSSYTWAIVIMIVISWLTAFNVINAYNRFVFLLSAFLFKITEPPLRLIRRFLPAMSGIDFAPMVLILLLWFIQEMITRIVIKLL